VQAGQRPSIKDVARLAGVSVGTVSNVLNRPQVVSQKTQDAVEGAMAQLHFHRNATARNLRSGATTTVGAVVSDVSNPFYTGLLRGIEDRLDTEGLSLIIGSSDGDPERERRLLRMLAEQGVRGVLITAMDSTLEHLAELDRIGLASVLMDAEPGLLPSVGVDSVRGGRLAVEHLLEQGHRRIAFLAAAENMRPSELRRQGAVEAVRAAGLDPAEVLQVIHLEHPNASAGEAATARLLDSDRPPTAVFSVNDIVALGALRALRERGVRVPEEVSVVGYDDLFLDTELAVPLTSVRQPMRELGWAAADLLLTGRTHELFTPELVVRASSWRQRG
jgi:LacI family transcriptional regulator